MSKLFSGAEIVFKCLEDQDVEFIFGYPGGAVLPIYDELKNHSSIKHILVRHEQGAGHAAEGYARSSGKPGVVLVTSGPGATNVVTALTDAYMDSVPLVCISGQVPTHLIGTDAFQECDTTGITRPCTKHNWLVKDIKDLAKILHEAFKVATTGRPGPVLVDIPKDIQFAKVNYSKPKKEKKLNGKIHNKFSQNEIDIPGLIFEGNSNQAILMIIQTLPYENIFLCLYSIVMLIFLCTTYDSCAFVLASAGMKSMKKNPDVLLRIIFSLVLMILPGLFLFVDGLEFTKNILLISSIPLLIVFVAMMYISVRDA